MISPSLMTRQDLSWCREKVAQAMRVAMTQTLDGSRGLTADGLPSPALQSQEDSIPSARLQVSATVCAATVCMHVNS